MDDSLNAGQPEGLAPLSERLPGYAATFSIGVLALVGAGVIWWALTEVSLADGIAYSWMAYGVLLLLVGGATGGGFTNIGLGSAGTLFGGRTPAVADLEDPDTARRSRRRRDPMERLRAGLRPKANPTAFWQVIGGICYLALGIGLTELAG